MNLYFSLFLEKSEALAALTGLAFLQGASAHLLTLAFVPGHTCVTCPVPWTMGRTE